MEYKKINRDNYSIQIIKTDRFKTISFNIFLTKLFDKNDIPYLNLLCKTLIHSTKKYNTENKLGTKLEELYSPNITSRFYVNGNLSVIKFSLEIIDPLFTEESMYIESLKMLKEVLFNPNIEDNKFNEEILKLNKDTLISNINMAIEDPTLFSIIKFKKLMYNKTPTSYSLFGSKKEYENITSKDLYNFYKKIFKDFKINIVILGNINNNEKEIIEFIDKMFSNIKNNNEKDLNVYINSNKLFKYNEAIDKKDYNQSILIMGYRIKDISEYELKNILRVYNFILGGMSSSILFNTLRNDNSLCYHISSTINRYNTSIIIESGINKKNFKAAINLINKCLKDMKNIKKVKPVFEKAIKTANTYLNDFYDDPYKIIDYYYLKEFDDLPSIEESRENLLNVKIEDVIELAKKVYLSTLYFMEGEKEE